jgi:hypothetical protein
MSNERYDNTENLLKECISSWEKEVHRIKTAEGIRMARKKSTIMKKETQSNLKLKL